MQSHTLRHIVCQQVSSTVVYTCAMTTEGCATLKHEEQQMLQGSALMHLREESIAQAVHYMSPGKFLAYLKNYGQIP